ncbi:MAG TPA: DEAD/DEAH box helicase, partial [Phycicoccus sp.]|nr:DEAD/DEAH box helicase [Phycicoccus sp.]
MSPKSSNSGAPKARWSAAKKAEARKGGKGPKKAHHRGQPDGPRRKDDRASSTEPKQKRPRDERSPRWDAQDPRRSRPARDDRSADRPR